MPKTVFISSTPPARFLAVPPTVRIASPSCCTLVLLFWEVNTVLGIFADNGVKGAEGGTALRNVILSLTAPTDSAKKKMSPALPGRF